MPMRTAMQLKLSTENLSIISKSVINHSAVVFFFFSVRFYGKVLFHGDMNVLFLQL